MPYLKVNDINLYYERTGAGQPLIFINGRENQTEFNLDCRVSPEEPLEDKHTRQ